MGAGRRHFQAGVRGGSVDLAGIPATIAAQAGGRVQPADEHELAEAIRSACEPLWIRGGGTRGALPGPAAATADDGAGVLSTAALAGVRLYEPAALTLIAGAGTPLADISAVLAAEGQRLAFEPTDWRAVLGLQGVPTLGGAVAVNASGPRRLSVGAARDFCLGVSFVDGSGTLIRNGGRVMKNVTGYDLVKLLAGSWGTLGVMTEIAVKVLPIPETERTLVIGPLPVEGGLRVMTLAVGSPFGVSGAARLPDGRVLIRVEGFAQSVAYRAESLQRLLAAADPVLPLAGELHGAASQSLWAEVRDVRPFAHADGDLWRFALCPSEAAAVASRLAGACLIDWGGGLLWALVPPGTDARHLAAPWSGQAQLIRAGDETRARMPRFQPQAPAVARLAAGLKDRFDPRGILNPGLMGPAQGDRNAT